MHVHFDFVSALLCIDEDDEVWMDFATHLGYKEEEVEQQLAITSDPIMAIFNIYKEQGRDPKDFLRVMYEISRKLGLRKAGVDENNETGSEYDAFNMRSYSQQTTNEEQKPEQPGDDDSKEKPKLKQSNSLEKEGINLEPKDQNADDLFDAATVVLPGQCWLRCSLRICSIVWNNQLFLSINFHLSFSQLFLFNNCRSNYRYRGDEGDPLNRSDASHPSTNTKKTRLERVHIQSPWNRPNTADVTRHKQSPVLHSREHRGPNTQTVR